MNQTEPWVTEMAQRIAREACSIAAGHTGRLLVSAWAEDGVSSADVFQADADGQSIEFLLGSVDLLDMVLEFRVLTEENSPDVWSGFALLVEGGSFSIDFFYQELDDSFDSQEYRRQNVRSYLGDLPIRYPERA